MFIGELFLGSESESTFEKFFDYHRGQEVSLSDSAEPALSYEYSSLEDFDEIMNSFALVQVTERRRRVVAGDGTIIKGHFGVGISLENKGSKI